MFRLTLGHPQTRMSLTYIYVVHQQDRLLSCQLHPTFPPAWKECGAVRLSAGAIRLQTGIVCLMERMIWDEIVTLIVGSASANQRLSRH